AARSAQQRLGREIGVDDESEIALDRLERGELEQRARGTLGAGQRRAVEEDFESDRRPGDIETAQQTRMDLAERAQHLGPEAQGGAAPRMIPVGRFSLDL